MDPYEILNIHENATPEEIKKAYHAQIRKYHPDFGGNTEMTAMINLAYATLQNKTVSLPKEIKSNLKSNATDYIYKRTDNSLVFLAKDYSVHKVGYEKLKKYDVTSLNKNITCVYSVLTDFDFDKLNTDVGYQEYVFNTLLTNSNLEEASRTSSGYIGKITFGRQIFNPDTLKILCQLRKFNAYKLIF